MIYILALVMETEPTWTRGVADKLLSLCPLFCIRAYHMYVVVAGGSYKVCTYL